VSRRALAGSAKTAIDALRIPDRLALSSAPCRGELDLAILALPADTKGLKTRSLFAEAFLVAMPAHHRLTAKKRVKSSDLRGEKLLLLEEGHCLRDQALEVCARVGTEEQDFRATSLETLRQMVAAGLGLTLLPRLAAEGPFASARGLVVRPFAPPSPNRVIGAAWRRSSSRGKAIAAVCDLIERA
jgi:LysR family hydrogen peroxide-inducible transcriptional activator